MKKPTRNYEKQATEAEKGSEWKAGNKIFASRKNHSVQLLECRSTDEDSILEDTSGLDRYEVEEPKRRRPVIDAVNTLASTRGKKKVMNENNHEIIRHRATSNAAMKSAKSDHKEFGKKNSHRSEKERLAETKTKESSSNGLKCLKVSSRASLTHSSQTEEREIKQMQKEFGLEGKDDTTTSKSKISKKSKKPNRSRAPAQKSRKENLMSKVFQRHKKIEQYEDTSLVVPGREKIESPPQHDSASLMHQHLEKSRSIPKNKDNKRRSVIDQVSSGAQSTEMGSFGRGKKGKNEITAMRSLDSARRRRFPVASELSPTPTCASDRITNLTGNSEVEPLFTSEVSSSDLLPVNSSYVARNEADQKISKKIKILLLSRRRAPRRSSSNRRKNISVDGHRGFTYKDSDVGCVNTLDYEINKLFNLSNSVAKFLGIRL